MQNEQRVRNLIRGSVQLAIQESVAALIVIVAFAAIQQQCEVGSPRYYGCLVAIAGAAFIGGVVWSHALSDRLLQTHPASDVSFWQEAFRSQARLLRWVPLWYCGPLLVACLLFVAPTGPGEYVPFAVFTAAFVAFFAWVAWLNRRAAKAIDQSGAQLGASVS